MKVEQGLSKRPLINYGQEKSPQEDKVLIPLEALYRQFIETLSHGFLQEIGGLLLAALKGRNVGNFGYEIIGWNVKRIYYWMTGVIGGIYAS